MVLYPHPTRASAHSGFSLVELLGVIAIIVIIAAVIFAAISGLEDAAQRGVAEQNVITLNEAIERFQSIGGDFASVRSLTARDVIDTLISTHPDSLASGGPFLAPGAYASFERDGWRAVMITRTIQGRTQVYFDITNEDGPEGIGGFQPSSIDTAALTPLGLSSAFSRTWGQQLAAPALSPSSPSDAAPTPTFKVIQESAYYKN